VLARGSFSFVLGLLACFLSLFLSVFVHGFGWRTPVSYDIVRLAPYQRSYCMVRGGFLLSFIISVLVS
jgi:hypothetical protein